MIIKIDVELDDILLCMKYDRYETTDKDSTKEDDAIEYLVAGIKERIHHARLREEQNKIVVDPAVVTSVE